MCIVFVAVDAHPRYDLIVAANRDEFYDRPTAPCAPWDAAGPHAGVLAGRDLRRGGTWMGLHPRRGVWAAVTNVREGTGYDPEARSRGTIPVMVLTGAAGGFRADSAAEDVENALRLVCAHGHDWDGFNLVAGTRDEVWWVGNRAPSDSWDGAPGQGTGAGTGVLGRACARIRLRPGVHAVSNCLLDTPWPKAERGKRLVLDVIDADARRPDAGTAPLLGGGARARAAARERLALSLVHGPLSDTQRPGDADLPATGVGLAFERLLSSVLVCATADDPPDLPAYGTRAQTVVVVERGRAEATVVEVTVVAGVPVGSPRVREVPFALAESGTLGRAARACGVAVSVAAALAVAVLHASRDGRAGVAAGASLGLSGSGWGAGFRGSALAAISLCAAAAAVGAAWSGPAPTRRGP